MSKTSQTGTNGPTYTITVPLDREREKVATFVIKELDEVTYNAARSLWMADKELDATRLMLKELRISGDEITVIDNNLVATRSLQAAFTKFIDPIEAVVKKN